MYIFISFRLGLVAYKLLIEVSATEILCRLAWKFSILKGFTDKPGPINLLGNFTDLSDEQNQVATSFSLP